MRTILAIIIVFVGQSSLRAGDDLSARFGAWLKEKRDQVNQTDVTQWRAIKDRADWELARDDAISRLKASLGQFPPLPKSIPNHVSKTLPGDGFAIDNLVYESRPGLWVTANLYRPAATPTSAPGFILIHSHHNPKTEGELQDMGMLWAKLGCYVLVPDQLGHGERRQHPFHSSKDFPQPFKTGRQDYYFRYNLGLQLQAIGDSLIGWMAHDTMAGVSLLLQQPNCDPKRIILLGAVAGGGDPAAVAAALDPRIQCVVPFNFGGPQPETRFPLPEDAELSFNYMGGGSWESTRNMPDSAAFRPWMIVASVAPRHLIHAHEFAWNADRDPVWKRYQKIFGFYAADDRLAFTHGRGSVKGTPPESTHCNNIGAEHRKMIYPALKKWFGIPIPEKEFRDRRPSEELRCWTPELRAKLQPKTVVELAKEIWNQRRIAHPDPYRGRSQPSATLVREVDAEKFDEGKLRRVVVRSGSLDVPMLILEPAANRKPGVFVVGVSQRSGDEFFKHRSAEIIGLLRSGITVCLPDLPGAGKLKFGNSLERTATHTSYSATTQMFGVPLAKIRLDALDAVVGFIGEKHERPKIGLWGESFASVNDPARNLEVPYDAGPSPNIAEPMGGNLPIYAAFHLWKADVRCVLGRGGLVGYESALRSPFLYVPHDSLVPPFWRNVELDDVVRMTHATGKTKVRFEKMVDGLNRIVPQTEMEKQYPHSRQAMKEDLILRAEPSSAEETVDWFVNCLR